MSIGSLLLGAAVILLVGLFLARPLLQHPRDQYRRRTERQELLNQKDTLLAQVEILDFDFETGTMPEQDYKQQRRQMVAQAAEILKKLDAYEDVPEPVVSNRGLDNDIETAVAALRRPKVRRTPRADSPKAISQPVTAAKSTTVPQPKPQIPQTTTQAPATNGRVKFCSQCGQPVDEGDKFCAHCGNKIVHA